MSDIKTRRKNMLIHHSPYPLLAWADGDWGFYHHPRGNRSGCGKAGKWIFWYFDNNGIFHLIQMIGLVLLLLGVGELKRPPSFR